MSAVDSSESRLIVNRQRRPIRLACAVGTRRRRPWFYMHSQQQWGTNDQASTGVAAAVLISGAASAQPYPPAPPPPPPGAVVVPAPPPVPVPGPTTTTTTTVAPSPDGDHREVTIHKEMDEKGNAVIEKDVNREGFAGSTETHTKTEIDRDGGTNTTRETTTKPR